MDKLLKFNGVIRNVSYDPQVRKGGLKSYKVDHFNINKAKATGIVIFDEDTSIGFARWTAPKRTRSDALSRTYKIYHLPKKVVIIPIIKDEGYQTNNDRINFITFSWMNLSNVYIILAWYEDAVKHPTKEGRITKQLLNSNFINERLEELRKYQQTALHWNIMHFARDFARVFRNAVDSYEAIAEKTEAILVPSSTHLAELDKYIADDVFSIDAFRAASLPKSYAAAQRETQTEHALEYLKETNKAYFFITNWLGGEYHLTSDEIIIEDQKIIIQESKNTSIGKIPSLSNIQDGLFKLILFANMDELQLNGKSVDFRVRLKLTGNLKGQLRLPTSDEIVQQYISLNQLSSSDTEVIKKLVQEVSANPKLEVELNTNV